MSEMAGVDWESTRIFDRSVKFGLAKNVNRVKISTR
jgi:hypothetical protein